MNNVSLQGFIDHVLDGTVHGWAWDPSRPEEPVVVEISRDGQPVATITADVFRPDLLEERIGNGSHAFRVDLSSHSRHPEGEFFTARVQGSRFELRHSPFRCAPSSQALAAETDPQSDPAVALELKSFSRLWNIRALRENKRLSEREHAAGVTRILSLPQRTQIETTSRCNYKCVICPHGYGEMQRQSDLDITRLADSVGFLSFAQQLQLFGTGEPLMSPAFWDILASLDPEGLIEVSVNTNGTLLKGDRVERITRSALSTISISLDAARPETYTKVRGGDFDAVIEKIRGLIEKRNEQSPRRLRVFINMALMRENIEEFPEFVDLGADLGVDLIQAHQLLEFEQHSKWTLRKGDWAFSYADQLLRHIPAKANECIRRAVERARMRNIDIVFDGSQFEGMTPVFPGGTA